MKLLSWNVNGIRAAEKDGRFSKWLKAENPEVVCIQESKAFPEQVEALLLHPENYRAYWNPAKKPGYSGTALFTRVEPLSVKNGIGVPEFDDEGRVLVAEYKDFTLLNCYFPNSQRDAARLPYKLSFCESFLKYCQKLRRAGKNVVICGDLNIAHKAIDLKNPKSNEKNAGFLPEERAWMDSFIAAGYVDTFRKFTPDPGHYTWWSYRPGVREKNIGWRLDYWLTNEEFADRVKSSTIQPHVLGSDHCPVELVIKK
jgi:exodeoxyribonuclease-3